MDELIKLEVNVETGEEVIRPYNQDEIDAHNEIVAIEQAEKDSLEAAASAKQSAINKLAALGLTEEEILAIISK